MSDNNKIKELDFGKFLENDDDFYRWDVVFKLLSLDWVNPYLQQMNLDIPHFEKVYPIARDCIRTLNTYNIDKIIKIENLFQQTLTKISKITGGQVANRIFEWGKFEYLLGFEKNEYQEKLLLDFWRNVFIFITDESEKGNRLFSDILSIQKEIKVIEAISQEYFSNPVNYMELLEKQYGEWEKYLNNSVGDDLVRFDCEDIVTVIASHIRYLNIRKTVRQLGKELDTNEINLFSKWVKNINNKTSSTEMEKRLVDELPEDRFTKLFY